MDLDAYVEQHRPTWERLDALLNQNKLSADEADELLDLYQRVSTHLSTVRSIAPDPSLIRYLSALLARTRVVAAARTPFSLETVKRFVTQTFPAVLYRLRWWWGITVLANVGVGFALGIWMRYHPEAYASVLSENQIERLVNEDFVGYYTEYANAEFAALVWTNNAWVSAQCIAFGVLGVPVIYLLWQNILNVSVIGALMTTYGRAGDFWGFILPHGMLELTAVFVAGGTGLSLFWSWIAPGRLTRAQSMAQAGRRAMVVAIGLVGVLFLSGLIEGFVTPSGMPAWVKITIGALAEIAFLGYVFVTGKAAYAAGVTGDQDRRLIGDVVPVSG